MASSSARVNINMDKRYDRVIVLIDMDCFYCQVEEKLNADLVGKPIAVVQYNAWRGGGIIAVNYPARAKGVTRHMRGDEAQNHCPEIILVRVPNVREKADLTKYREAGKKVAEVLQIFTPLLERASVDEAYLDITEQVKVRLREMNEGIYKILPNSLENTFAVGYETIGLFIHEISSNQSEAENELPEFHDEENLNINAALCQKYNLNLLVGSTIVNEIRAKVKEKTGYECSAGIAHNKILAKLACGINKPNKQTLLSINQTANLLQNLPVNKIKGLGGKFGEDMIEELQIQTIGDILKFSKVELQKKYEEKNGNWLFLIARGIDLEAVTPRFYSKSIGCCKKFPGRNAITGLNTLTHWLHELANEIADRLDKDIVENNRKAKQMVVSFVQEINSNDVSSSRSGILVSYDPDIIAKSAFEILQKNTNQFLKLDNTKCLNNSIKFLGISVGKFENTSSGQSTLQEMFSKQKKKTEKQLETINLESELRVSCNNNSESEDEHDTTSTNENYKSNITSNGKNFNVSEEIGSEAIIRLENLEEQLKKDPQIKLPICTGKANNMYLETVEGNSNICVNIDSDNYHHTESNYIPSMEEDGRVVQLIHSKSEGRKTNYSEEENIESNILPAISSKCANLDYTKTYAEYMSTLQMESNYVKCSDCGSKVLSLNLQTHLDGHLAFKLSQQMREEYRSELKSQFSQNNVSGSTNKKNQLNNTVTSKNTTIKKKKVAIPLGNITKYLKPCEKSTIADMKNLVKCSECGCFVDEVRIIEHKDLHLAQKINQEWNCL